MTTVLPDLERELARRAEADARRMEDTRLTSNPGWARRSSPFAARRFGVAALTTAVAGLALFVVLALPVTERTRLDVVAQAKAALDPTSEVLHMVVTLRSGPSPTPRLTRYSNGETLRSRWLEIQAERWSTTEPLRYRQTTQQRGLSDAT